MSGSPFALLGLVNDAGPAEVRRAYARLLRTHRPDEDAAAFQRLHEAYQAALGHARWREANPDHADHEETYLDEDDEEATGIGPGAFADGDARAGSDARRAADARVGGDGDAGATHDPVHVVGDGPTDPARELADILGIDANRVRFDADADADRDVGHGDVDHGDLAGGQPSPDAVDPDAFDPADFFPDLAMRIARDDAGAIDAWLNAHPGLWSVDRKRWLRHDVAQLLADADRVADPAAVDRVLAFFGLDSVSRDDAWLLDHVAAARQRHAEGERFAARVAALRGRGASWTDRRLLDEIATPLAWWRRLLVLATPGLPSRASALAGELEALDPGSAAGLLHAPAVRFWRRATDRAAMRPERLAVGGLRLLLFVAILGVAGVVDDRRGASVPAWFLWVAATGLAGWAVYTLPSTGFQWLRAWNARHQRWDMATLMTGSSAALGALTVPWAPVFGGAMYVVAFVLWIGARGAATGAFNGNKWATVLVAGAGFAAAFALMASRTGGGEVPGWAWSVAGGYVFGVLLLHDVAWARHHRMLLARAHLETGCLWWIGAGHVLAFAKVLTTGFPN